jgi:hypothetical protein
LPDRGGRPWSHHEPHDPDHVEEVLHQRIDELDPTARRLRKALLQGDAPQSLGLVEDGLGTVLEERDIS